MILVKCSPRFTVVAAMLASHALLAESMALGAREWFMPETERKSAAAVATTKRGAIYTDSSATSLKDFGPKVTWAYDYQSNPGSLPSRFEFVPILWGADSGRLSTWTANAQAAINNGATHLLGFNEPDQASQSNLSPAEAAAVWRQYMQPFAGKAKLCSPAIQAIAPSGTQWLDQFLNLCSGCTIDCIAFHLDGLPGSASDVTSFQETIEEFKNKYNKPLWLTELSASGTEAEEEAFLETMLPWLDGFAGIERYAYFMAGNGILSANDGTLTPLGNIYNTD